MDSLQSVPAHVDLSWICQEFLLNVEFEQGIWLSESDGANSQALNEEVRKVEIRSLGQVLGQERFGCRGVFDDLCDSSGRRGRQRRDKKDLNDLECKVRMLDKQLDSSQSRDPR